MMQQISKQFSHASLTLAAIFGAGTAGAAQQSGGLPGGTIIEVHSRSGLPPPPIVPTIPLQPPLFLPPPPPLLALPHLPAPQLFPVGGSDLRMPDIAPPPERVGAVGSSPHVRGGRAPKNYVELPMSPLIEDISRSMRGTGNPGSPDPVVGSIDTNPVVSCLKAVEGAVEIVQFLRGLLTDAAERAAIEREFAAFPPGAGLAMDGSNGRLYRVMYYKDFVGEPFFDRVRQMGVGASPAEAYAGYLRTPRVDTPSPRMPFDSDKSDFLWVTNVNGRVLVGRLPFPRLVEEGGQETKKQGG